MVIDIDRFTHYNHEHTSPAMPYCAMWQTSSCRRAHLERSKRLGSDEFDVLLPSTPLDMAIDYAERIRRTNS